MFYKKIKFLIIAYLLIVLVFFIFQRYILYPIAFNKNKKEIKISGVKNINYERKKAILKGWIINEKAQKGLIYYGGNAEKIEKLIPFFKKFKNYTTYLIPYRGYSSSSGRPTEKLLYEDALFIFDEIKKNKSNISIIGRSLGTGIATHIAALRDINNLILITPYYSIKSLAKKKILVVTS